MKITLLLILSLLVTLLFAENGLGASKITIKWFGQSCFAMVTSQNTVIITDPVGIDGYSLPSNIIANIVTISHNHYDHTNVKALSGKPEIIYGLGEDGKQFKDVAKTVKDVKIRNVLTYHDGAGGKKGRSAADLR